MPHEPRLSRALRLLLQSRRVAALGTINDDGTPFVSMVPYAVEPTLACIVIHVSALAAHTRNLAERPVVSLLVMQGEVLAEPVHALPRVTLDLRATALESGSEPWQACRAAYLRRFPEAEPMTQLPDFRFLALEVKGARQVAGFGAARSIDADEVRQALRLER
jgi:putative heme iron utilization protein